jgi:hypothetical protein
MNMHHVSKVIMLSIIFILSAAATNNKILLKKDKEQNLKELWFKNITTVHVHSYRKGNRLTWPS